MGLKEDIEKVENKMKKIEEESFAMELLKDQRKQNKRLFIIWIITFMTLIGVTCYTIYLLNDIGTIETNVKQNNKDGYNNYIGNDGDITNGNPNN